MAGQPLPTEARITAEIRNILKTGNPDELSTREVRRLLEGVFKTDLASRKEFISAKIRELLA